MNLTARIKSHEQESIRLSRDKKHKASRAHALRAQQLRKLKEIRSELRRAS